MANKPIKISDEASVQMPMKTVASLIAMVAIGTWAYFGLHEMLNNHATKIELMQKDLEAIGRPFGEFIPGGNTTAPGQIDRQIDIVKKLKIKGKTVTVPESLKKSLGVSDEATLDKVIKKEKREARRKAREARREAR